MLRSFASNNTPLPPGFSVSTDKLQHSQTRLSAHMAESDDGFQLALSELIETAAADARRHSTRADSGFPMRKARPQDMEGEPPTKRAKFLRTSSPATDVHHCSGWSASSSTGPSATPLGRMSPDKTRKQFLTSSHPAPNIPQVVRRQFGPRENGIPYEALVEARRRERVVDVDRYVPPAGNRPPSRAPGFAPGAYESQSSRTHHEQDRMKTTPGLQVREHDFGQRRIHRSQPTSQKPTKPFRFQDLPDKVKTRIITYLLVKDEAILIDFTWLRSFVHGHSRVPNATKTLRAEDQKSYTVPQNWPELINEVQTMQNDCGPFQDALELLGNKTRGLRGPCRGLTTGLLRVSKSIHGLAAEALYGGNTFRFPWPTCAWMQLESFLATIRSRNVGRLRSLEIHVPLWHRGMQEDYLEGAILDLTSPASRLGVVLPTVRDRLLSAITSCVHALLKANRLSNLTLVLEHGLATDRWIGRHTNDRQLIFLAEAEELVARKQQGIATLQKLAQLVKPKAIKLHVQHVGASKIQKYDKKEFKQRLPGLRKEAEKYGWVVDQALKGRR
ncbi:hypothetical protein CBER1_06491 [Cercospora berteroae]|uniref:Uncharacterized protein n=1 Tax=Cercospora berteroae TaxID=357750 RepID=A0A2S6BTL0_9PEZI|nr:hypothetical protein CBER1_06491 [Cercospora berteroae]